MDETDWIAIIWANTSDLIKSLDAEALYEEFGIKSWPLFPKHCVYSIPNRWAHDIRKMLRLLLNIPGIDIQQIKEKFCTLRVYYVYTGENDDCVNEAERIINNTIDELRRKGLHP